LYIHKRGTAPKQKWNR
jgi:hypothetical protein